MAHLLDSKGSFLRSLLIESTDYISLTAIQLIGQACPGLRNLYLKQLLGGDKQSSSLETCNLFNTQVIFHNLRCLYLRGWNWNPTEVLPLCLLHAKQLETLSVVETFPQNYQDDVMASIINTNPLQELKAVHILTGRILSITTINYFVQHCPKLREMSFVQTADITTTKVKELCDEVYKKNLDLKIYAVEMNGPVT
jgi:CRISPR/Cas system-associated exonuclease Cas4 (RecB family)